MKLLTKFYDQLFFYRYAKLLQQYAKEKRERKRSESKRRSSTRLSESKA